ncbi:MAG: PAS domain S-box protein [Anaerolineae bacterium]|nr:PAS domain S-box protein [Anaerolineae bacterium]
MSKENDLYRILFESSSDAIMLIEDEQFVECNASALTLFGCAREDLIGRPMLTFSPPTQPDGHDSAQIARSVIRAVLAGEPQQLEWQHYRLDGTPFYALVSLHRISVDERTLIQVSMRDITERKRVEQSLQEAEDRQRLILETAPTAILVTGLPDGVVKYANREFAAMSGYAVEEILGRLSPDLYNDPRDRLQLLHLVQTQGSVQGFELRGKRKDGSLTWVLLSAQVIQYDGVPALLTSFIDISKRRAAEEALRQANLVVESSPVILFRWRADEHWTVELVSDGIRRFGYTPEDLLSGATPYASLVHPNDLERVASEVAAFSASGVSSFSQEYRIVTQDGQIRWTDDRMVIIRDANGAITHYEGIVIDSTERKQAEQTVQASQQMLQLVMDNIPQSIFWKDSDLVYLGCNRNFARDAGMNSPQEIVGKTDYDMPWQAQAELYRGDDFQVMRLGDPKLNFEEPQSRADGGQIWLRTSKVPLRDADGNIWAVLGMYEDITDRKQMEQSLRDSEARYAILVEQAKDGVLLIQDNIITFANQALADILGYDSPDEIVGTPFIQHVAQASKGLIADRVRRRLAGEDVPAVYEAQLQCRDGAAKDVEVSGSVIEYGGKQTNVGTIRDISERKRAEMERERLFERRAQQAQVSAQVAQELAGVPQLDELFHYVVTLARERLGYYHAQIFRYDPEQDRMVVVAGYGEAGARMVAAGHGLMMGTGVVGTAAATGASVLAPDVRQNPDWQPNPNLPATQGELAVPIKLRDQVLGILDVQSDHAGTLTIEDQLLLESLCGQIAIAMESTRLIERTQYSEQLMRTLIDAIPDHIYAKDTEGRFTLANVAAARLLGGTPQDLIGKSDLDFYPRELAEQYIASEQPILRDGVPLMDHEEPNVDAQGHAHWNSTTKVPVRNQQGQIVGLVGMTRDITERRRAEAELNERLRELNSLYRTVSREGWQSFRESTDLPGGYVFDPSLFSVATVDERDPRRALGTVSGLEGGEQGAVLSLPLQLRGESIGVVGIDNDPRLPLSAEDQALVQAILDQAVEALESARLAEMTQEALAEAEATHRRYLRETWGGFLSGRGEEVEGYLATPDEIMPAKDFWTPEMEQALLRQQLVVRTREQVIAPGREGDDGGASAKSLALPIRHRGQTIGVIDIAREGEVVEWSEDELAFIQSLVDEVGDLIESERLFEESEFTRAQTELLYQASQRISTAESPDQVYPVVLDTISSTAIDQIAILVFGQPVQGTERPSGREIFAAFWDRNDGEIPFPLGTERPVEQDPFLMLLTAREVVTISDTEMDGRIQGMFKEAVAQMGARALALVPLTVAEEWQGYVSVTVKTPHVFGEDDLRIYRSVSDQAAIVLRSLRLYQEAESRARREQLIRQITNRMRVHADVDSILSTAVRELGQALGVSRAFIRLTSEVPEPEEPPAVSSRSEE